MYIKEMIPPPPFEGVKMKKSQIKIASARIPIPRNNPAKFHNNPIDRGVADNRFRTYGRTDGTEGQG